MAANFRPVMKHGPLEEVFPDVFYVWGTVSMMPGFTFLRNMTIVREGDELSVISAIRLSEEAEAELAKLGKVKHLLKIGYHHGMDDPYYVDRYQPNVWAAPDVPHADGVKTDTELVEGGALPFSNAEIFRFANTRHTELAILIKREGGILLTCDSVQNWDEDAYKPCSWLGRVGSKAMGFRGKGIIGPMWRKMETPKGGPSLQSDFERLLALDFRHLLSGHGTPLRDNAKELIRQDFHKTYK